MDGRQNRRIAKGVTMPIIIAAVVIAYLAGRFTGRPALAYLLTGAIAIATNIAIVWAVADDKGNDPGWLVLLGIGAAIASFVAAWLGLRHRSTKASTSGSGTASTS